MSGNANLPRQQNILLQNGAARQSGLRANDIIFAHDAGMAHLHQAVDLGSPLHASFADGRTVDGGQCLDLDVILDDRWRRIGRFCNAFRPRVWRIRSRRRRSRRRFADVTRWPMRQNSRTDACAMSQEIVADLGAFVDHYMRMQNGVAADPDVLADIGKGSDRGILADVCGLGDERERVDAGGGPRRLIEQLQCAGEIQIGIQRDQAADASLRAP